MSNFDTNDDLAVLTRTLVGEIRNKFNRPIEVAAVACVIRNRVNDKRWPNTYSEVCLQPKQFSCWNNNDPNYKIITEYPEHSMIYSTLNKIALGVINNTIPDVTMGANHYLTPAVANKTSWFNSSKIVGEIGPHIFLKL